MKEALSTIRRRRGPHLDGGTSDVEGAPRSILLPPLPWTGGDGDGGCLMDQAGPCEQTLCIYLFFSHRGCRSCYGTNRNKMLWGLCLFGGGGYLGLPVTRQRSPSLWSDWAVIWQGPVQHVQPFATFSSARWHLSGMRSQAPDAPDVSLSCCSGFEPQFYLFKKKKLDFFFLFWSRKTKTPIHSVFCKAVFFSILGIFKRT